MATVSAALIVRNEADLLPDCLRSLVGAVDEIVAVDTGSTDATMEVMRSFGVRYVERVWQNDFSLARNESMRLATKDWVLVIDADERLAPGAKEALAKLVDEPSLLAVSVRIANQVEGGLGFSWVLRLTRRRPDIVFAGNIHESIAKSVARIIDSEPGWHVARSRDLTLDHLGYRPDVWARRGKAARNANLLAAAIASDPTDPYLHYKLYQARGGDSEGAKSLRTAAELLLADSGLRHTLPVAAEILVSAGVDALGRRDLGRAEESLVAACHVDPRHPGPNAFLGLVFAAVGKSREAIECFRITEESVVPEDGFFIDWTAFWKRAAPVWFALVAAAGEPREIERIASKYRHLLVGDAPSFARLLQRALAAHDFDQVLTLAQTRLRDEPMDSLALRTAAAACDALGRPNEAEHFRQRLPKP